MEAVAVTQKIQIKHWSGRVLFKCDVPPEIESGFALRHALEKATAARTDLRGAVLRGADLRGAVLRDAVLSDADLRGAVLSGAVLRDAVLSDADLRGADLRGADLRGAVLRGAVLSDADLRGAVLSGAVLRDAVLSDADLRGADLSGADLRDADLRGAVLSGAVLSDADLSDAENRATDEQATENLDRVRAIILDNNERLEMNHWHQDSGWKERTCAEETLCATTHCLAGWLQVCSTDEEIRKLDDPQLAGILSAPIASKMFFRRGKEVLSWLEDRKYVTEMQESAARRAARAAARATGAA